MVTTAQKNTLQKLNFCLQNPKKHPKLAFLSEFRHGNTNVVRNHVKRQPGLAGQTPLNIHFFSRKKAKTKTAPDISPEPPKGDSNVRRVNHTRHTLYRKIQQKCQLRKTCKSYFLDWASAICLAFAKTSSETPKVLKILKPFSSPSSRPSLWASVFASRSIASKSSRSCE